MIDTSKYTNEELKEMFLEQQRKRNALCFTSSVRWESEAREKHLLLFQQIEDLLNENVDLFKYVRREDISQIVTVYQMFNLESNIKHYLPPHYNKQKVLRTYPLMTKNEYKKYIDSNNDEAMRLLSKKTLDGIMELKTYENSLNFDWQGLYNEIKELLEKTYF